MAATRVMNVPRSAAWLAPGMLLMTTSSNQTNASATARNRRANALAERLEQGAQALATLASGLSDAQWQTHIPGDGRRVGVVVHHVATMYPLEVQLAQTLAAGNPISGVSWQ